MATEPLLYNSEQVRELDRLAIDGAGLSGLTLMRRAAAATVDVVMDRYGAGTHVAVYCGSGNNAADGFIVAGMLAERDSKVEVIIVGDSAKLGDDGKEALRYMRSSTARETDHLEAGVELIVDALLGTGIRGDVRPAYSAAIEEINGANLPVVSVDMPSGLCADTGSVLGVAVMAEVTVTFVGRKLGLYTHAGPDHAGDVVFSDLSIPESVFAGSGFGGVSLLGEVHLPRRRKSAYKNEHGHVLVIGGNHGMGGAVALASEAALRSGAGLVTVATRAEHTAALLARRPEVMAAGVESGEDIRVLVDRADVIVIGPGLGRDEWAGALFAAAMASEVPMVVDADGLFHAKENGESRTSWLLTPHPGEARMLLDGGEVQSDRLAAVHSIQRLYNGVVILKGTGTLVTDGSSTALVPFGNPGMATAGMGDVLSGVAGAMLSQGLAPYKAAATAATLHSLAGDHATRVSGEIGLVASDLAPHLRKLVNGLVS